ncbi:Uncharacterized conserved protein, contains GH25 family domain [Andreprevotia lacus DSM 23236]|jgi:uncharacterized GH25 family protein|uniref:Uncharacterized conserved protein, contains GH25 family domain n=1 Tax=Andreprevotia lacus DSM 23236 TaxID=1121001 RepID=A0A1W1XAP0_9NEIS|nr:DUF4198 domain-containing protein [Andreprevotia lacus]SMC20591.1 Uncharacterized conserved protein, contains GH25 family domain [Andreprevotia lacus DSM 23236]
MTRTLTLLAAVLLAATQAAHAHSPWLLPSSTVLASPQFVTVDAGASTKPFIADHRAMPIDQLAIVAPDGSKVQPANLTKGELRSTFDVKLEQKGTYRMEVLRSGVRANWKVDGQPKRWMGTAEAFAKEVPADAADLQVSESASRLETFVTVGAPSALKPSGKGLELVPVTHPNDLVEGENATFQFLVDGKPAEGVEIELIRGQTRYRNQLDEQKLTTGKDGKITVKWAQAGMYWLGAELKDNKVTVKAAKERNLSYTATLEVLPQ